MELNSLGRNGFVSNSDLTELPNGDPQRSKSSNLSSITEKKKQNGKSIDDKDNLVVNLFPPGLENSSSRPSSAKWKFAKNVVTATSAFKSVKLEEPEQNQRRRKMKGSDAFIPVLPLSVSYVLLLFNCLVPGSGTMLSSFTFFCLATTYDESDRNQLKDKTFKLFFVNFGVGLAQLFTSTFFLVGWFWGLSRSITMIYLSREAKENGEDK